MPDRYIASVGWIYRRCNGRDNPKEQSWNCLLYTSLLIFVSSSTISIFCMIVLSSILHCENIIFLHYTLFPFFPQLLPTDPRNSPVHNILFVPAELIIFSIAMLPRCIYHFFLTIMPLFLHQCFRNPYPARK